MGASNRYQLARKARLWDAEIVCWSITPWTGRGQVDGKRAFREVDKGPKSPVGFFYDTEFGRIPVSSNAA